MAKMHEIEHAVAERNGAALGLRGARATAPSSSIVLIFSCGAGWTAALSVAELPM
ncbi:hypothetical protein ABIF52_007695 [Bradyrhizobium japonicum]|uniref:hypothetical protein n=1 Tax=Bradyrhizobium diazoefficiens TaxID=1355477 RepID=UPI003473FD32